MKTMQTIMIVIFLVSAIYMGGCSSETDRDFPSQEQNIRRDADITPIKNPQYIQQKQNDNTPQDEELQFNRSRNSTGNRQPPSSRPNGQMDENMQQQFEEMQQKAIYACKNKNEGDACKTESPMGEMEGKCTLRDSKLTCMREMPVRTMK